jgi:hypothetical protein
MAAAYMQDRNSLDRQRLNNQIQHLAAEFILVRLCLTAVGGNPDLSWFGCRI